MFADPCVLSFGQVRAQRNLEGVGAEVMIAGTHETEASLSLLLVVRVCNLLCQMSQKQNRTTGQ